MMEKGFRNMGKTLGLFTIIAFNLFLAIEYFIYPQHAKGIIGLFWVQSVLLGMENFILILVAKTGEPVVVNHQPQMSTRSLNIFMAFFFLVHHGVFIIVMGLLGVLSKHIPGGMDNWPWVKLSIILLIVLMVFDLPRKIWTVNHKSPGVFQMMFIPYIRLFPFGLIILAAGVWPLHLLMTTFLVMKMGVDLVYHFYVKI